LIDTPRNRLQGFKTLVFVGHLSPFESFSPSEINRRESRLDQANRLTVACGAYHVLRDNLFKPDLRELGNCRDESQVFSMRGPSSRKDRLFEWSQ
jgi:hypothetical protein